jgi:ABC-type branched-subunit amino acid transport system ATPase component/branched-subunit amino acid ABC-type transport system permease component
VHDFLPFIVSGLATGAIFGLFATGLVLTYKTSGIFNFGHGAIATAAAYFFYFLHVDQGLDWVPALVIAVFVIGPLLGIGMERFAARLSTQRTALKIVGTIGLVLLVQALATIKYGATTIRVEPFLPHAQDTFRLFGVVISYDKVIVAAVSLVSVALLYALFRYTRLGIAMRAVVDDPDLVAMQATNAVAVRRTAWIIGSTFAALSGVLYTSFIGVDNIALTFLVVQALGAAAIGLFSSIPLTFVGALLIGVGADLSKKYVLNVSWLSGFPDALPFIVLFVALLVTPRRKLVPPSTVEARPALQYRAPARVRLGTAAVVLVPLLFVPQIVGAKLPYFTTGLCSALLLLSLGLLVRTSGQVSLCHAAFAAIGAVAFSQMRIEQGMPWLLALIVAGLIAVPVGAVVAVPAIRLSGLFLALATLGFGILVQKLLYTQGWMFTTLAQGRRMPAPSFADTPKAFYYVVLAAVVITGLVVAVIQRSRLGRLLQGMSGSSRAVTSMGLSTNVSKVIVFCTSAFFAAIAGALLGVTRGFAVGSDNFYLPFFSLVLLAMLTIAPFAEPWYALIPAVAAVLPGYISGEHTTDWLNAGFGLSAVIVAMQGGHPPAARVLRRVLDRLGGRHALAARAITAEEVRPVPAPGAPGIKVRDLKVRFGGLTAVDGVSFEAPLGRVTGLIGPNGAGKTTTFDACSGLNRRYEGRVHLHGNDVTKASPATRARRGLGRTFQRMELCETLTVLDNVILGREAGQAGARPQGQLVAPRSQWREAQAAAWSALELCGIAELAEQQAGALSTGQRRLVELARCLAGPFDVLLLDEPSSGLDHQETARFGELLQRVVADRGIGILLVEHDMELVMRVCEHIYILDFGRMIFEGTPSEIAQSEVVQAAYLGSDEVMEAAGVSEQEVAPA